MTIETLNAIKTQAVSLEQQVASLGAAVTEAENQGVIIPADVDNAFEEIRFNLTVIVEWVQQAIDSGTVEEPQLEAMAMFLSEIKAVFEKYSAVLSIIDGSGGYGEGYGEGTTDVIQFTVTDPVSGTVSTKEFIQTSLSAVDLV